jgi:tetratricopeptide (TPR) repeat protein
MSKSSVVVLPVLLLLLDYWPLGRFPVRARAGLDNPRGPDPNLITLWKLTLEKLPFFGLSVASALITLSAQAHEMSAAVERRMIPIEYRLANGAVAVLAYLRQTVWPTDLSVFYPPTAISLSSSITIVAVLGVAAATALAVGLTRLRSYIGFGWCWFLVLLAPVSGFVQAGDIVQADRYTYLSSIGLSVMAVWALADLVEKNAKLRYASAATAAVAVALLASLSQRQVAVWRNTRTLFTHAASVTPSNHVALTMIAGLDLKDGKVNEAITNLTRVLEFAPKYPSAEYHLGEALQMQGRMVEAIPHLEAAAGPEVAVAGRARLVLSLIDAGRLPDAETALEGLLAAIPGQPDLLIMKAALLREQGRSEQAGGLFRSVTGGYAPALADNPRLNFEIAELYSLVAENRKAMPFFEKAVELAPDFVNALNDFAWILATDPDPQVRNGARAVELAERACKATGWKQPVIIGTLGAAYAEAGQFDKAIQMAEKARDLARQEQLEQIAAKNEELLKLYKEGKPYREIGK